MEKHLWRMLSSPSLQWCRWADLGQQLVYTLIPFRSMSTSSRITLQRPSKACSDQSLVCPVVSPCTGWGQRILTSHCSSQNKSLTTIRRIGLTLCTWRTCCILVKIDIWLRYSSSTSRTTRPYSSVMLTPTLWHQMNGLYSSPNVVDGSTPPFITWPSSSSWTDFAVSAASLCASLCSSICSQHWSNPSLWHM